MWKLFGAFLCALSFVSGAHAQLSFTATTPALVIPIPNASSTGTTNGSLAKLTGAPSTAVITATTDTSGVIGVVVSGAGTTGSALIARSGQANCTFDGATTAGHYVINSANVAGDCEDGGATYPTSGQVLGRVLTTNGGGGSYAMTVASDTNATSGVTAGSYTSTNITVGADGRVTAASNGSGGVNQTSGYISGNWYGIWPHPYNNSTTGLGSTTQIQCVPSVFYYAVHVDSVAVNVVTLQAASAVQVAIYNSGTNGLPSTLVGSTPDIATTSNGVISGSLTSGPFALSPGPYWFCAISNNTSVAFNGMLGAAYDVGTQSLWGIFTTASSWFTGRNSGNISINYTGQTYGTWPNLTSVTPTSTGAAAMIEIAWHTSSVP